MYAGAYSEEIARKLAKLKRRNPVEFSQAMKKISMILESPEHGYKFLSNDMKGLNRVHLGHFVLVFRIDHAKKIVSFEDYDHHDNIYANRQPA